MEPVAPSECEEFVSTKPSCASARADGPTAAEMPAGSPALPKLPSLPEGDEELFMLYVEADSDRALREIVNRYQPKIIRYFQRNAATRSRAEDLTQEVFIRIVRNRASFDPNQKFSTWSKTIAERIAINAARSAQRSRVTNLTDFALEASAGGTGVLDPPDPEPLPDEILEQRERNAILYEALGQVEPRYREPATLKYLREMSHTEAAKILGIPVGTAKSRTSHALRDMRKSLLARGLAAA